MEGRRASAYAENETGFLTTSKSCGCLLERSKHSTRYLSDNQSFLHRDDSPLNRKSILHLNGKPAGWISNQGAAKNIFNEKKLVANGGEINLIEYKHTLFSPIKALPGGAPHGAFIQPRKKENNNPNDFLRCKQKMIRQHVTFNAKPLEGKSNLKEQHRIQNNHALDEVVDRCVKETSSITLGRKRKPLRASTLDDPAQSSSLSSSSSSSTKTCLVESSSSSAFAPWEILRCKFRALHAFRANYHLFPSPKAMDDLEHEKNASLESEKDMSDNNGVNIDLDNELRKETLQEEMEEELIRSNDVRKILTYPEYFSAHDRSLVQMVAEKLGLMYQESEGKVEVYKKGRRISPTHASSCSSPEVVDDIVVNVPYLASKGKDFFIGRLKLERLDSAGGHRRNMLWDVAQNVQRSDAKLAPVSHGNTGGVYRMMTSSSSSSSSSLSATATTATVTAATATTPTAATTTATAAANSVTSSSSSSSSPSSSLTPKASFPGVMFKPTKEEKFVREGLEPGEGAAREEAAYVIDSMNGGFSNVPPTTVARLPVTKDGSITKQGAVQRFITSKLGSLEDRRMPSSLEEARQFVEVEQVHKVGILDIRLFNTDRHLGNILLLGEKAPYSLTPIDHGCILPSWFHLAEARFDWISFPQSEQPFSLDTQSYIHELKVERDMKALRKLGIREECIMTFRLCHVLLTTAVKGKKTLAWIGRFMQRTGCLDQPSEFEKLVLEACEECHIPFRFVTNDYQEQTGMVEPGVFTRRLPNSFFDVFTRLVTQRIAG